MEVEINMLESEGSIGNKVKHDKDVMKPISEAITSGSLDSDMSNHGDGNDDDDDMVDDAFDFDDDDDYMFENFKEDDEAHYLSMQAQFDNVDLPPGVEASFSWLNDLPSSTSTTVGLSNSSLMDPITLSVETHDHEIPNIPFSKSKDIASSSLSVLPNIMSSSASEKEDVTEEEVKMKFDHFKLFDIVDDFADHHFNDAGFQGQRPPKTWTKKIQDEWKILENNLPDTIFVRAYETRMDLLRAVVVGAAGTPYHDGLFVFDMHLPPTYPDSPPMVYYYSRGLRLNPNLYESGKVCLSLLNTWAGIGNENWVPNRSTMLQVLLSIQALILNDKPFFNEPGHDDMYPGAVGEKKSKIYNERTFILSLKTMMYTLGRPPKHFEDLVVGHFRSRAHAILSACRAYMEGFEVGLMVNGGEKKDGSKTFKADVGRMVNGLVSSLSKCGATNCDQFRVGS
ncbi:putative ubiquitin-conjugating enzyme E2 38 [Cynara cardunculus var. scolymus]|uniref:putative ubiquitin-conjugating enzyme E2 38 n=1 Tax=Cynara cardunculus var. scolymus TaxID=59895 RepID=UPI000D6253C5|nr:putative ubiquitin-conjugating enzyme E2 38 [Cynara cardunculus var. scolymus]